MEISKILITVAGYVIAYCCFLYNIVEYHNKFFSSCAETLVKKGIEFQQLNEPATKFGDDCKRI